jgi:phosphopantothenoylcysteine decarboxylase/phosphopantothenate--cysteine ligase
VRRVDVESCEQMHDAVLRELPGTAIFVGTAAVADYRPVTCAEHKIKKRSDALTVQMTRTPDILADVASRRPRPFVVGFAAETQAVEQHAREKLVAKHLDMIAANEVGHTKGFDTEQNALLLLWPGGKVELPTASKCELARALTRVVIERYREQLSAPAQIAPCSALAAPSASAAPGITHIVRLGSGG